MGKLALNSTFSGLAIYIYMAREPNIEVKILEQLYNLLTVSCMMAHVEIWGLDDGWQVVKCLSCFVKYCKIIMGIPNMAENET